MTAINCSAYQWTKYFATTKFETHNFYTKLFSRSADDLAAAQAEQTLSDNSPYLHETLNNLSLHRCFSTFRGKLHWIDWTFAKWPRLNEDEWNDSWPPEKKKSVALIMTICSSMNCFGNLAICRSRCVPEFNYMQRSSHTIPNWKHRHDNRVEKMRTAFAVAVKHGLKSTRL